MGHSVLPPAALSPAILRAVLRRSETVNPVELTLRHSFRRVEDFDYEFPDWDGVRFRAYGAFDVERRGYTRNYGLTDDRWHRFILRYNIWQYSHRYTDEEKMTGAIECYTPETTLGQDPNRDDNENGTADECEQAGPGSRCDTFKQKCTLPYAEREVRPIVWYYTNGSDQRFFEGTRMAAHEWDVALRTAVRTARYTECKKTVGQRSNQVSNVSRSAGNE